MRRPPLSLFVLLGALLASLPATDAFAQLTPAPSASGSASPTETGSAAPAAPSAAPSAAPIAPLAAPSSTDAPKPRPDPGPSVKERGSRARRSNPASGPLFVAVLIGAMAYYVIKKIRRRM
ncbi:MAG: hypothetical protein JST00_46220 [Deltaproteobacteria bacterium]|nr:hypothetical protein [Deltaproteobacteria bacterium]